MLRPRFFRFFALFLLLAVTALRMPHQAAGAGDAKRPLTVSAVITGDEEGEKRGFTGLFLKSIELELKLEGLSLSEERKPDVFVRGTYDIDGNMIGFSLSAEVRKSGVVLFSIVAREELGLALDIVLLENARRMTRAIAEYRRAHEDIFKQLEDIAGERAAEAAKLPPAVGEAPVPGEAGGKPREGFVAAADIGYFVAAGEAGRYFKAGYSASAFGGFAVSPGMDAGFSAGVMYFTAEGYAAEAQGLILPFGFALRFRPGSSGRIVTGFRADAGGALFMVMPETGSLQSKIIPAAEAGMTVNIAGKKISFHGALCLTVFYESDTLLYGFTPRVGLLF